MNWAAALTRDDLIENIAGSIWLEDSTCKKLIDSANCAFDIALGKQIYLGHSAF